MGVEGDGVMASVVSWSSSKTSSGVMGKFFPGLTVFPDSPGSSGSLMLLVFLALHVLQVIL